MVGASKILTVSYGTFSCTLEGFDEPFNTMKAIAEYFRDLAADDRYFGAEPPQPDAEMLHRIAEREIQRRVEAKIQENGVVLRQQDTLLGGEAAADEAPAPAQEEPLVTSEVPQEAAPSAEAPAQPEVAETPEPAAAPEPVAERPEPEIETQPAEPEAGFAQPETVAAKLQRIREAVARARVVQADSFSEEDEPVSVPEALLNRFETEPSSEAEDFGYDLDISGPLSAEEIEPEASEPTQPEAEMPEAEVAAEASADAALEQIAEENEEVAEVAREDEEVVTEEEPVAEADETEAEDIAAAEAVASEEDAVDEAEAAFGPTDDHMQRRQASRRARRSAKRAKRIAALKAAAEELGATEEETVEQAEDQTEETSADTTVEADAPRMRARVIKVRRRETIEAATAEVAADASEELPEQADDVATPDSAEDQAIPAAEQIEGDGAQQAPEVAAEAEQDVEAEAELEAEAEEDDLAARLAAELSETTEEASPAPVAPQAEQPQDEGDRDSRMPGRLSPEAEADLMRELAALQMENLFTGAEIETADETPEEAVAQADVYEDLELPDIDLSDLEDESVDAPLVLTQDEAAAPEAEEPEAATKTASLDAQNVLVLGNAIIAEEAEGETSEDDTVAEAEAEDEDISADVFAPEFDAEAADETEAEDAEAEAETVETADAEDMKEAEAPTEVAAREAASLSEEETDREAEVDRLLAEADKQAEVVETRRRFSAIAHLKAAVAATVADRLAKGQDTAKGGVEDEDGSEPYRADLTQAVRPRRPVSSGETASRRPDPLRPAPLVLVSEQRVDADEASDVEEVEQPAAQPAAAIRPRRVSAGQFAAAQGDESEATPMNPEQATSFAEFAESLGTQGLSDLLEAAAAYTSAVEGRPHFSPPQIMRKLSVMDDAADVPREERMRVFGRLLRQGKITKVKRGQYAITEASRYWDEAKMASGQ
ncbi:hypothetical protein BMI86_03030 [Thioclava sp. DLFJ5-1]|uniref:hypothetical protein n=1 Tax=Thioclava sp. DLFJ5-1 TaxID=1915314 RepID=UPI000996DC18|nr:hypothetical protein [Thioclava sp. DLFJ5-1]OOY21552.1 hypothetical protein BMI86_03030 [Thioclava sp. DLFJ5-1]